MLLMIQLKGSRSYANAIAYNCADRRHGTVFFSKGSGIGGDALVVVVDSC